MKKGFVKFIICIILIVLAVACVGGYFFIQHKLNMVQTDQIDETKVEFNDLDEDTQQKLSGYETIALFGLDNRQASQTYDTGHSDVIVLLSINHDTKQMQMVSVYRDTYLNISTDDYTFRKANAAYQNGGAEMAMTMLNTNLDLKVDDYVTFDFQTVADAIDALGGVEINIESDEELGYLNKYIDHTNGLLGTSAEHVDHTGKVNLGGVQAVAYGRIRYTSGSDFKRAERHRRVMLQAYQKLKEADVSTLNKVMNVVLPEIQTSFSKDELLSMASTMLTYEFKDSRGFPFEKNSIDLNSKIGWVDVACDLETNVKELHEYLYGNDGYEPSDTVKEYSQIIIDNTGFTVDSASGDEYEEIDDFDSSGDGSSDTESSTDSSDSDE